MYLGNTFIKVYLLKYILSNSGGIFMEENIVEEMSKKYNKKEVVIETMISQCIYLGLNKDDSIQMIEQFYKID